MTHSSTQGIKTALPSVSNLAAAKEVYAALLGVPPQADGSYYVGFEAEGRAMRDGRWLVEPSDGDLDREGVPAQRRGGSHEPKEGHAEVR